MELQNIIPITQILLSTEYLNKLLRYSKDRSCNLELGLGIF